MRLHFREKPWDLLLAVGYSIVVAAVVLALKVGNPLAILLVLFVPGYVVLAALFPGSQTPDKRGIDWIERIALSFGLSIAVAPLFGLLLDFTPFGIRLASIVSAILAFTAGVGYAAYWRRMRLPVDERLSLTVDLGLPDWKQYGALDKGLTTVLAASIIVAGGTLAYVILAPRPGETFTQFYILGPGGNASDYPTTLNVSEPGTVVLGLANHEAASVNYDLRVDLVGVQIVYNSSSGLNETVEVNRTTWSTINVTLDDGQNWTQRYIFQINSTGLWKVQFLLYKDDAPGAYRKLHFFVTVL